MPFHHRLLRIVVASIFLISSLIQPKASSDSVVLPVSFTTSGYNNPIEIKWIQLLDANNQTLVDPFLDPHSIYRLSVGLSDWDGFDEVSLRVSLLHLPEFDINILRDTQSLPNDAFKPTDLNGEVFTFHFNHTLMEDIHDIDYATDVIETNSTWELVSSDFIPSEDPTNITEAEVIIDFKVSHVAVADANWVALVEAQDTQENSTRFIDCSKYFGINWYGEIRLPDSKPTEFTVLHDADYTTSAQTLSLLAISNGRYTLTAQVGETWKGVTKVKNPFDYNKDFEGVYYQHTESPKDPVGEQRFAFSIHPTGNDQTPVRLSRLNNLDILTLENRTNELGDKTGFDLHLHLSGIIQNGRYEGTLIFGIANPDNPVQ